MGDGMQPMTKDQLIRRVAYFRDRCYHWHQVAKKWRTEWKFEQQEGITDNKLRLQAEVLAASRLELNEELEAAALKVLRTSLDREKLLRRANMALLCYTQSHGTPHTQLMDEMAEALGLDADGNTLKELGDG